ncbi:MAG TPA: glycine betaine ABC transporter substrate-binding protein [Rhodothermales bacterium]|nr:glycine betaine ABC transporter substrate-binding protein [Rhodothermales bacterium]
MTWTTLSFPHDISAQDDRDSEAPVVIGSKKFTESVVLGELIAGLAQAEGVRAEHRKELGGTRVLWEALLSGDIDVYPDYTGTLMHETLSDHRISDVEHLAAVLESHGVRMTRSLGFNNTYALGMRRDRAGALGIRSISNLIGRPDLVFGFSNEFIDRADGWPGLQRTYRLPQQDVRGLDHSLAYRGLVDGALDVIDLYTTDAEIQAYDLVALDDDRGHFPEYKAVILYRADLVDRHPEMAGALGGLEGVISERRMAAMNARSNVDGVPETVVAADFLSEVLGVHIEVELTTRSQRLWKHTREHLTLVLVSLFFAILVAIPLGVIAYRHERIGALIVGVVGVIFTIPSLALLVFMIPLLGIGAGPAMVALFLYSLLPIVRNTHSGLKEIPLPVRESALALGLSPAFRLRHIELPMASGTILAGIKTAAVINIGTATLGALIGAGGYGQPILTGIRLNDVGLILEGAVPAALLAILAQSLFGIAERFLVPRGLRL